MSIAELIMQGTNRASNSTAWVGDSLAKLGQNVGQALAQREQQKQAQEMLPMFQQSMQESMNLAGQGKSGEAYAKLMPFITDPAAINNPYVLPAISAATKFIDNESNNFLRKEQLRVQEGMYGARSDYQNSLLALRENQATAKAEVDNRRLAILEDKNNLMWQRNQTQDENEKARIDIQLQRLDLDEQKLDSSNYFQQQKLDAGQDTSFQQSYEGAAGIGGPRSAGTPLTSTDRTTIEQAAQDVTNAVLLPDEVPQPATGIPAMVTQTTETPTQPFTLESPAAAFTQLGEKPYEPSEEEVQRFVKNFNEYESASPKGKQKIESKRTIVYDNLEELKKDVPSFNTEQIGFTQVDAGIVDPELVGIKYLRNVEKGRNAQGKITEYGRNEGAVKSVQDLQTAFDLVNRSPELNELYTKAGGWKGVQLKETPKEEAVGDELYGTPQKYEVINRKTKEAIKVSKDDYNKLQTIEAMVATANTMGMDFITVKGQQPAATETPSPTQGGLPATQLTTTAPQIPEEAMALQKIVEQGQVAKAGETAKNVEKRIKDIDTQIKQLSSTTTTAYDQAGLISVERSIRKTPEQAQTDIQKIAQLKKQKKILQGKYDTPQEVGEALQSGLLTRAQADAILKNQFKMQ
jgi:hypothetical protein